VFGRAPPEEPAPAPLFSLKNNSYKTFGRAPPEEPELGSTAKQALRRPLQGAQKRH